MCVCVCAYLMRAAVTGAVFLINDDWVCNVSHNEIPENKIPSVAAARPSPRLHPHPVLCLGEH